MLHPSHKHTLRVAAVTPARDSASLFSSFASNFLTRRLPALVVGAGILFASSSAWAAVTTTALPYSWGWNNSGQLGNGSTISSARPIEVTVSGLPAGVTFTQVSTGLSHSVALGSDGQVYTWGDSGFGQLGRSTATTPRTVPGVVGGLLSGKTVVQVMTGYYHSVALCEDGTVYTWGDVSTGALGRDVMTSNTVPGLVKGNLSGKKVTQIAAGSGHTLALDVDGNLYAWGENWGGQLGTGNTTPRPEPAVLGGLSSGKKAKQIAAGGFHSLALDEDGQVFAWGYNYDGPVGDGTKTNRSLPVAVLGIVASVTQIEAGHLHSVALDSSGKVYSWGYSDNGQLGRNTGATNVAGVVAGALENKVVTQISAGVHNTVALCADGSLYSWGYGGNGELGNNGFGSSAIPVGVDFSAGSALNGRKVTSLMKGGHGNHTLVLATGATASNSAPVLSNVVLSPSAPKTNQTVTATPTATDVDGDVLSFTYIWKKNGQVIPGENGKTLDLSKAGNGDRGEKISVEVTANDGKAASVPFTSNALTVANTSPVATGVTVTPSNPTTTSVLSASASGTDVDNDRLSFLYQWRKNGVAIPGATAQTLDLAKAGNGDSGDVITVEAKARDNSANSAPVFSTPITVAADAPTSSVPTITSISLSPANPKTLDVVKATVSAIGVNGDSDQLTFSYIWKINGSVIDGESGNTLDLSKPGNGDKGETVTVEVVAHEGASASDTASASATVANTASAPTSVVLSSYGPGTNDVLTATAQGFDVDGDPFTFLYQWKKNGAVINGETGPTLNLAKAGNGDTGDKITVEVKTRDAAGQSAPLASAPATVSGAPAALAARRSIPAPSAGDS